MSLKEKSDIISIPNRSQAEIFKKLPVCSMSWVKSMVFKHLFVYKFTHYFRLTFLQWRLSILTPPPQKKSDKCTLHPCNTNFISLYMFRLTLIMMSSNSFPFVFLSFILWLALGNSPVCDNCYRRISGNINNKETIIFPRIFSVQFVNMFLF